MEKLFSRAETLATSERQKMSARLMTPTDFLQVTADEVERAGRYHRPLSVALIQVTNLQMIRKADGQAVAECVFADATVRVIHGLRAPDRVARLGPGQLGVLLPETTLNQGAAALERLDEAIKPVEIETPAGRREITIAAGLAGLSARMRDPKAFLMLACFELRRAQSGTGSNICVAPPDLAPVTIKRSAQVH